MNSSTEAGLATAIGALVERLRQGDVRALARAISIVENDAASAADVLSACFPYAGGALRVGITGSPGAGKSTLVDRLTRKYRAVGQRVGIIAVDPTSPFTGGAILGDRIRFREDVNDPGLYVRSMATRGALGGLAHATADVASVVEASGKDVVLIETVGVGQDEVDVVRLADITVVVLVPGMGDDVQSIKAGIMEIADIFVINKADREGADRVEKEIRAMQSLVPSGDGHSLPPIVRTVANTGAGTEDLTEALATLEAGMRSDGRFALRRRHYWQERIAAMLRKQLLLSMQARGLSHTALDDYAAQVAMGKLDPYRLVQRLVGEMLH